MKIGTLVNISQEEVFIVYYLKLRPFVLKTSVLSLLIK